MLHDSIISVLSIFILIGFGLLAMKMKWLNMDTASKLPNLIINISLPAQILITYDTYFTGKFADINIWLFLVPFLGQFLMYYIAVIWARIIKIPKGRRGVFCVLCSLPNGTFIGFPIVEALFGGDGLIYGSFYVLMNTLMAWTWAYVAIRRDGDVATGQESKITPKDILKRLITPPTLSIAAGMIIALIGVKLPAIIARPASILGGLTTPLAMIYIGCVVYNMGKEVFKLEKGIISAVALKLVAAFGLCYGLCALTGISGTPRDVYCIQNALPVMIMAAVLPAMYGADEKYAAKGLGWTTAFSIITIPLVLMIL